jgi:hypothetical protein
MACPNFKNGPKTRLRPLGVKGSTWTSLPFNPPIMKLIFLCTKVIPYLLFELPFHHCKNPAINIYHKEEVSYLTCQLKFSSYIKIEKCVFCLVCPYYFCYYAFPTSYLLWPLKIQNEQRCIIWCPIVS